MLISEAQLLLADTHASLSMAQPWPCAEVRPNNLTRLSSKGILILLITFYVFFDFCRIWHQGGFGRMENTPTGHADDLPAILGISKNDPKSRSVNICSPAADF